MFLAHLSHIPATRVGRPYEASVAKRVVTSAQTLHQMEASDMPSKRPQRGSKDLPSYVTNLSAHASGMWTTRLTLPDGSKKQVYLCSWKTADYKEALRVRDERQAEVDAYGDDSLKSIIFPLVVL